MMNILRFAFFGTPRFAEIVLDELEQKGFVPTLIVTAPDKPKGRKLIVTPSEVKVWAQKRGIPVFTPEKLRDEPFLAELKMANCDLFIVAAYGKIIPKLVLDMPRHGALNVHPSLLPKLRGPSPVESTILSGEISTGVTIILLDEEMDHGPIIAQCSNYDGNTQGGSAYKGEDGQLLQGLTFQNTTESTSIFLRGIPLRKIGRQGETLGRLPPCMRYRPVQLDWPPKGSELSDMLAHQGGMLLVEVIPEWMSGKLKTHSQDHSHATYTKKIVKEDGMIDLSADPLMNYRKIRAFDEWPGAYFFTERNGKHIRVRITDATYADGRITIVRVLPEGKREMSYEDFLRGTQQ
ncbi:MAG: methionyl-tRNA formyltransferase [bacterium]|nr:methionyl-tRNA formyltransferase [bacterium]